MKLEVLKPIYDQVASRDGNLPEFMQAVEEVLESLEPVAKQRPDLEAAGVFERLVEPERVIVFYKVTCVNELLHPVFAVNNAGLNESFSVCEIQSVRGGHKKYCGMALAVLFVDSVLYADITVTELINLDTTTAKVKIRVILIR